MVPVHCHTNLDDAKGQEWPSQLPCRPIVGDVIQSKAGLELKVVAITFRHSKRLSGFRGEGWECVDVELHMCLYQGKSVLEFQNWFKKWKAQP